MLNMAGDPRFPGHTDEFKRIMDRSSVHPGVVEGTVRSLELEVTDLMNVREDELVLLSRFGGVTNMPVEAEIARRNIVATLQSVKALGALQATIQALQKATTEAADRTTSAVSDLETEVGVMSMDIKSLDSTAADLHTTTQAAAKATTQAITRLDGSIKVLQVEVAKGLTQLRTSGDRWSRWLTRLTIAVVGLTALLVIVTLAPVWR